MIIAFWRGESVQAGLGFKDLIAALIICSLEVSLSFDNAVVNAIKLEKMSAIWRKRFLTWGIAVAVFGMRFVFPIVIVAIFSGISCREVLNLALNNPDQYAHHLHEAHVGISSFGGAFLLMLFFEFMFEKGKTVHWLPALEKPLNKLEDKRCADNFDNFGTLRPTNFLNGRTNQSIGRSRNRWDNRAFGDTRRKHKARKYG